jgi:protein involved in polysaccharide export with SLBB domain
MIALLPRRTAFLPFAAILLASGCFLPHPDEPAGVAAAPPAAAREFEAPPALPSDVTALPDLPAPSAVPGPETRQAAVAALVAAEQAGIATAMQKVASGQIDYRLAPADRVSITVYKAPDMSRKVRVDPDGAVSLVLLGPVKIGGLTMAEAQAAIENKLAKYLVNPQISLSIEEYGNKTIFVMGEVQNPGSYAITAESRMTVPEAIRAAGGFTADAARDRARLLRTVDGASVTFTITQDVVLEPNDVVFVPQNVF